MPGLLVNLPGWTIKATDQAPNKDRDRGKCRADVQGWQGKGQSPGMLTRHLTDSKPKGQGTDGAAKRPPGMETKAMTDRQSKHLITKETAAAYGSRGGKARAAKAARYKTLSEAAKYLLAEKDKDGQTAIMQIINAFIDKAKAGDIKAAEFLRDLTEGKPTAKVQAEINTQEAPKIIFDIPRPFDALTEMEKAARVQEVKEYLNTQGGNA